MINNYYIGICIVSWTSYCLFHIWRKVFSGHGIPQSIPWPGNNKNFWSRGKSTLKSFLGTQQLLEDGYQRHSRNGHAFVLPNLVFGPEVILPVDQMQWLVEQPEDILSQFETNRLVISGDVTLLHPQIMANRIHKQIMENEMSKRQDSFADEQIHEIQYGLNLHWGNDSVHWKEIPVFDFFNDLMTRVVARTFVGLPLCRDQAYLHSAHSFNAKVPLVATLEQLSVPILRPFMVRIAHALDKMHYRRLRKMILSIIAQRVPQFQNRTLTEKLSTSKIPEDFGPNDFIQWALKYAFADNSFHPEHTPEMIAKQLAVMSFASTHSTALSLTNILFDIATHPDSLDIQQTLRSEITEVIARQKQQTPTLKSFGRTNLTQMVKLDSAIRESLRRWGFSTRGVQKAVMAPEGVTLPTGEHLPRGTIVGISSWSLHKDESYYKNALSYQPWRFSDRDNSAEVEALYGEGKFPAGGASMTSTGDRYLVFSHGRWACPGRFFAQNNLKRIIAQIILNYDIEPLSQRPKNIWFNNLIGPPMVETVRVRRRGETQGL